MIEVIPCGTDVTIKLEKIPGTITGITIKFSAVAYEVSYFFNGEFYQVWMNECLFIAGEHTKEQIGFIKK